MSEILSPDEVEALLEAFAASAPGGRREPAGGAQSIDLTNREHRLGGRLPGLDLVLGRFARALRGSLATFFGRMPGVVTGPATQVKFEQAFQEIGTPAALVRFGLAPLRGHGLLAVPASFVGALLEAVCGGSSGRVAELPAREFSPIEQRVIERLAMRVLADLRAAWEPVATVECAYLRTEASPLFATIAAPDELVLQVTVTVALEATGTRTFALAIPNAALDPIRTNLQTPSARDDTTGVAGDGAWTARLHERLAVVPIGLAVDLGTKPMAIQRLLELKVGDLVTLDTGRDGPVLVRVAGRPHFRGAPGVVGGSNAVRVTERF